MPRTLSDLRALCRRRIGDNRTPYIFSDLQINQWVTDAIAEYSVHFPRKGTTTITTTADDRDYDLPARMQDVISVEYPTGEEPPKYLERRHYTHPDFWLADGYYDVVKTNDESNQPQIYISQKPADTETITVKYTYDHDSLDDDTDECTVIERHFELLVLHLRMSSAQELASSENADPDQSNLLTSTLETNANRAERSYRRRLQEFIEAEAESATSQWLMDKHDRAY